LCLVFPSRRSFTVNVLVSLHSRLVRFLETLSWLPPLLARLAVGWIFAESGWGKLNAIEPVIDFFTSLNLPAPAFQAYLVACTELIAGSFLILGLATRYASVPLIITMIVAIVKVTAPEADAISDYLSASEFLYITLMIWLIIAGPGKVSLDALIKKRFAR
jgi:putative oxidoreductase